MAIIYDGGCAHVIECLSCRSGGESFSWFQSTIVFYTRNEFLNCSLWAVGTMKHLVLLVVSCWTNFEDTWSGKCLG